MDRAVKVSKRELNELMRELMEFTENMSSDDEDKDRTKGSSSNMSSVGCSNAGSSSAANNDDMSLFLDAYMSLGSFTPQPGLKTTPPPSRSPNTPTLHTPVPPMSPPSSRTPTDGLKDVCIVVDGSSMSAQPSPGKGKLLSTSAKKQSKAQSPGKLDHFTNRSHGSQISKKTIGKPDTYLNTDGQSTKRQEVTYSQGKLECFSSTTTGSKSGKKQKVPLTPGKPDSFLQAPHASTVTSFSSPGKLESFGSYAGGSCNANIAQNQETLGLVGVNMAVPVVVSNRSQKYLSSPGKEYFVMNPEGNWEKDVTGGSADYPLELVSTFYNLHFIKFCCILKWLTNPGKLYNRKLS